MARVLRMVATMVLAVLLLMTTIAPAFALDPAACWGNCGIGDPKISVTGD